MRRAIFGRNFSGIKAIVEGRLEPIEEGLEIFVVECELRPFERFDHEGAHRYQFAPLRFIQKYILFDDVLAARHHENLINEQLNWLV